MVGTELRNTSSNTSVTTTYLPNKKNSKQTHKSHFIRLGLCKPWPIAALARFAIRNINRNRVTRVISLVHQLEYSCSQLY